MAQQLLWGLVVITLLAGCGSYQGPAAPAQLGAAPARSVEGMVDFPSPAPEPAPPAVVDQAPAPTAIAAATLRAGYLRMGGRTLISAAATGLSPGLHAFHLHAGCDGRPSAHLATLTPLLADPAGGAATTSAVPAALIVAGETVIVYPGPGPVGAPVLCARL